MPKEAPQIAIFLRSLRGGGAERAMVNLAQNAESCLRVAQRLRS